MNATPNEKPIQQLITQETGRNRAKWPAFAKGLPRLTIRSDPDFRLIPDDKLEAKLKDVSPEVADQIRAQTDLLNFELMKLFQKCDQEAAISQNLYHKYQIIFIALSLVATVIGSFQAMARDSETLLALFAMLETVVALFAVFVSRLDKHEPPLGRWLENRRRAEGLRQEYFRYLMYAEPYDKCNLPERELLLAKRAAEINRGSNPDSVQQPKIIPPKKPGVK